MENPGESRDQVDSKLSSLARRAFGHKLGALPTASDLDDDLLLRYFDGAVSADERATLERRLVVDRDAKERLSILAMGHEDAGISRQLPQQIPVAARAANAVSRFVFHVTGGLLELLRGEGATVLQPALSVRGAVASESPSAFAVERQFHTAQGALSARFELHAGLDDAARADGSDNALVDLVVHVGSAGSPAEGIRCKLLRDGRPIDSREVERNGCTFARLAPARYDVELRKGGVEVGRLLFDLRG